MFTPGENENDWSENWLPPAAVTREEFLEWRAAGYGNEPAEEFTNPVWLWLIDTNISAYLANDHFKGPDLIETGSPAGWCFNRFGRTTTDLPDGRRIIIGGEHEDHYDPDFFIYNDVVVVEDDGKIRIFGYPESHFPPTDFHTATLFNGQILLVGSLGYPEDRRHGDTQVYLFHPETLRFTAVSTSGEKPGWISNHQARLDGETLVIEGGKVDYGPDAGGYLDNFDRWQLDLETWQWKRLTRLEVSRWKFTRADRGQNRLLSLRSASFDAMIRAARPEITASEEDEEEEEEAGLKPGEDFDRDLLAKLYIPPVAHQAVLRYDWEDPLHFMIDGIRVDFEEDFGGRDIFMTAVGEPPVEMLENYAELVRQRLSDLEGTAYLKERL